MNEWAKSQRHEANYDEAKWGIPKSLQYWLDFLKMKEIHSPTLEVGCGENGLWRFSPEVTGIDPLDYSELGSNFKLGRAEELPYPDDSFRDVIGVNFLDHTEDPTRCFSEMARVASERVILWSNVFPTHLLYSWVYAPHPYAFTRADLLDMIPKSLRVLKSWEVKPTSIEAGTRWGTTILSVSEALGVRALLLHLVKI